MLRTTFRALVRAVALLSLAACAHADADDEQANPLKRMSLEQLSQIQITSVSKLPSTSFTTPAAAFVLTQDDIRRSGATNIPDALRLVPGVEVMQIDSAKWAVGIRGFAGRLSKSVLVLIDGRSVYTPLFAGVYWEMQDTLLEDVERIEVIRGPGGAVWGPNAVNGVINIITKHARDTQGALLAAGGGNVEQGFGRARYGGQHGPVSYRIWSKMLTRGPEYHSDGRNFDDWRRTQAGFRIDADPSQRDSFTLQGDAYESTVGTKLGVSFYSPPALINVEQNGYFFAGNILGRWQRAISPTSNVQLQFYWDRTERRDVNAREARNTFDIDFVHRFALPRNSITWGTTARFSPSRFTQTVSTVDFLPHEQTYTLWTGFVQDEIALVPRRLALTVGTKLEYNTYGGFDPEPDGRLAWTPNDNTTVWGAVTRAVRTPSRIEDNFQFTALAVPTLPLYIRLIGDGQFHREQMNGYELGVRQRLAPTLALSLSTFYNQYDDLLSVENRPPVVETAPAPTHLILPIFLRNGVRGNTRGAEFSGLWDINSWWRVQGSYSYVHLAMRNRPGSNDASTVRQLQGDSPSHKVVLRSAFDIARRFDLDLTYRYVSSIPDQRVEAFSTADARFAWRVRDLEFSVVGQNLLQPYHYEYGGSPGPLIGIKRAVYGKIEWRR